jgi:hypothetical protein
MSLLQQGEVWWYEFWFAGRRIRESTKSESKIVAKAAEKIRRRERKNAKVTGRWQTIATPSVRTLRKAAPATGPSWTLPVLSRSACSATTAIFEWRQSGRRSNRSSKSSRMTAQKRRRTLKPADGAKGVPTKSTGLSKRMRGDAGAQDGGLRITHNYAGF